MRSAAVPCKLRFHLNICLPPFRRGSLGTAHVRALAGLVRAAQAKHGSLEGMEAAVAEKAAKKERAAASKQEAADARRAALAEAAGVQIT